MKPYHKLGTIGRFKPVHLGGKSMLEALCEQANQVTIGIGSCNRYNARNPFTAEETEEMIDLALSPRYSNYATIFVPDFAHLSEYADGQRWKQEVFTLFGKLDAFVTGNKRVAGLLQEKYQVVPPDALILPENRVKVSGTQVRREMVLSHDTWKSLVPMEVADYLEQNKLVERFRTEFALKVLLHQNDVDVRRTETTDEEYRHGQKK